MIYKLSLICFMLLFSTCTMGYSESGSTLFDNGIAEFQKGRYQDAVFWFTKLIEKEPFNAKAYKNRGVARLSLQKYDMAIEDLNSALNLDPELEGVRSNLGVVYHYMEKYSGAIEYYNEEIKKFPDNHTAFFNRALSWSKLNEYENALKDLNTVLTRNPNEYWALAYQGDLFAKLNNLEAARDSYQKAISLSSDNTYAREQLALLESSPSEIIESPMTKTSITVKAPKLKSTLTHPNTSTEQIETPPILSDTQTTPSSKISSQDSELPAEKIISRLHAYTIQLGAFLESDNAKPLIRKLQKNGYEPRKLNLQDKKSRKWTLVRLGVFETYEQATKKMQIVKKNLKIDAVVRPVGRF
ncbi:SPOR domain-containing protein [Desulfocicer niacini]